MEGHVNPRKSVQRTLKKKERKNDVHYNFLEFILIHKMVR